MPPSVLTAHPAPDVPPRTAAPDPAGRETVAVVIPSYNAGRFVAAAVTSAEAQSVPPHEIIVVDDGSTDDTLAVLAQFGSRITVVSQPNRGLPGCARNAGAARASATWLAFLDADDTWLPHKLERQLAIGRDPAIALVYSDRYNRGARGALPERQGEVHPMFRGDIFLDLLLWGNAVTASSAMIRRHVFEALGGFAEHLRAAEDWDLWLRVAEAHTVGVVDEPLVNYTFHQEMFTGDPARMRHARDEVMRRALTSPRGSGLAASVRRRIRAAVARTNAWDASRKRAHRIALAEYAAAIGAHPWDPQVYVEFLRYVCGRHR